jgi:hypothetical protein
VNALPPRSISVHRREKVAPLAAGHGGHANDSRMTHYAFASKTVQHYLIHVQYPFAIAALFSS